LRWYFDTRQLESSLVAALRALDELLIDFRSPIQSLSHL
jgi:hypothetical protein